MTRIRGSIWIARPPEEVFDFVADERNEPSYNLEMLSVAKATAGPIGVGTRWQAVVRSQGRETPMEIEVTAFERPVRLVSRTTMDAMLIEGATGFAADAGGTTMTWDWQLTPRGWLRLMTPLVGALGRSQERRIWRSLKAHLETPATG